MNTSSTKPCFVFKQRKNWPFRFIVTLLHIPEDWGKAIIVPIFKKKDKLDCANYRGISLLTLPGKVFCSILHNRMKKQTEEMLSESQAGFRSGRSTVDQLFTLRQITEKLQGSSKTTLPMLYRLSKSIWHSLARGPSGCNAAPGIPIHDNESAPITLQNLQKCCESRQRLNWLVSNTDWIKTRVHPFSSTL